MKLQILITHYKEPIEIISNFLDSINNQLGIDFNSAFEVIICDDGSGIILPVDILTKYKFKIKYIINDHVGVSYTRNTLLDISSAEYLMFCDSDDVFCDQLGLYSIFKVIDDKEPDVFISPFYEETVDNNYILRQLDSYFVHGKVFKRKYLIDNDIRWQSDLVFSGDIYFLRQALSLTNNMVYWDIPYYIWCFNDNSICRKEKNHFTKEYFMHIKSQKFLVENFINRKRIDLAKREVLNTIQDMYFRCHSNNWLNLKDTEEIKLAQNYFNDFYRTYKYLYDSIDEEIKIKSYNSLLERYRSNGPISGYNGIDQWLDNIVSAYN